MRAALKALAITTAAFAAPLAMAGPASASTAALPPTDSFEITAVDAKALIAELVARGGCTTTYVNAVLNAPIGQVIDVDLINLIITVDGGSAVRYTFQQVGNTTAFVRCLL